GLHPMPSPKAFTNAFTQCLHPMPSPNALTQCLHPMPYNESTFPYVAQKHMQVVDK
ncbi:hypothetical protein LSAT2_032732, partial [Lamellibrachia satsuma]